MMVKKKYIGDGEKSEKKRKVVTSGLRFCPQASLS
jgi:hypothetical protein